jgi:hypothetical protein
MFQPYMFIIRLAHKQENKYTVAFRIELSMLNISTVQAGYNNTGLYNTSPIASDIL